MTSKRITRRFVDGPLGTVHLREAGQAAGRQTLVLLHQTADSSAMFEAVMPLLATRWHVIAPDTPGFGESAPPAAAPGLDGYVGALIALADTLGLAKAHWLGHHSGASFALQLAARHASRVDRLVLCGLPDFPARDRTARIKALSPPSPCSDRAAIDWAWQRIETRMRPWANTEQLYTSFRDTIGAIGQIRTAYEAIYACDVSACIEALHAPTLLLFGEEEGFAPSQRQLASRIRGARLHAIEGAGASTMLQAPQAFADAVHAFLGVPTGTLVNSPGAAQRDDGA